MNELYNTDVPMDDNRKAIFDRMYLDHYDSLLIYVRNAVGYGRGAVIEDILQDTFLTAWKKLDEGAKHENQGGWLMEIAKNKLRNLRKKASSREVGIDDEITEIPSIEPGYGVSELEMIVREVLDPHEQELFQKYFVEGYSVREMAAQENLTESAFKVKMHRIRRKLQKHCE